jgi:hypothetical protein
MDERTLERREFVKKVAYIAPVVLTLAVAPAYAKQGSEKIKDPKDPKDPKEPKEPKDKGK